MIGRGVGGLALSLADAKGNETQPENQTENGGTERHHARNADGTQHDIAQSL